MKQKGLLRFNFTIVLTPFLVVVGAFADPKTDCASQLKSQERAVEIAGPAERLAITDTFAGRPIVYLKPQINKEAYARRAAFRWPEILAPNELTIGFTDRGHVFLQYDGRQIESVVRPVLKMKTMVTASKYIQPGYLFVIKNLPPALDANFCALLSQLEGGRVSWLTTCARIAGVTLQDLGVNLPWVNYQPAKMAQYFFELKQRHPDEVDLINLSQLRPDSFLNNVREWQFKWAKASVGVEP